MILCQRILVSREPALLQLITQYNNLQLQRAANLKTTPASNPMIQGFDASLNKIRQNITQALKNVKQSYLIAGDRVASGSRAISRREGQS